MFARVFWNGAKWVRQAFAGDTGWNGPPVCRFPGFKAVLSTKTFAGIENMLICIVDLVNNWTENKVLGGKKC